jgi:hypothetical protein
MSDETKIRVLQMGAPDERKKNMYFANPNEGTTFLSFIFEIENEVSGSYRRQSFSANRVIFRKQRFQRP